MEAPLPPPSPPPPPPPPPNGNTNETKEGHSEEQAMEREVSNLVLPEDGYEWRKYGQKFIRNINKTRSYYRCRRQGCNAKKNAVWTYLDINDVQVTYEGTHTHGRRTDGDPESNSSGATASSSVNQYYNLYDQMLRRENETS